jgi:hypothetical protein
MRCGPHCGLPVASAPTEAELEAIRARWNRAEAELNRAQMRRSFDADVIHWSLGDVLTLLLALSAARSRADALESFAQGWADMGCVCGEPGDDCASCRARRALAASAAPDPAP